MIDAVDRALPRFLKRVSHRWLINHPLIWAGKYYHVLFFGFVILGINLLISLSIPVTFTGVPSTTWFLIYSFVVALIFWIVWVYTQSLISYRYLFGKTKRFHDLIVSLIFLSVVFLISVILFIPYWNLNNRISRSLIDKQLPTLYGYQPVFSDHGYPVVPQEPASYSDTTDVNAPFAEDLNWSVQKDLPIIENLEIAKAGLPFGFDILNESEVRSLPENKRGSLSAFVVAVVERPGLDYYSKTRDTLLVYFNQQERREIRSEVFDMLITKRKIWVENLSTHQEEFIYTYSFTDPDIGLPEHFSGNRIQNRLITGKVYKALLSQNPNREDVAEKISSSLRHIIDAKQATSDSDSILSMVLFFSLLCSYLAIMACTVIKLFGLRSFLISLCSLILSVVLTMGGTIVLFDQGSDEVLLVYFVTLAFPMTIAALGVWVFRTNKKRRVIFAQWISFLFLPFAVLLILLIDSKLLDNFDTQLEDIVASFFLYILLMLLFMRSSYKLYTLPGR